MWRLTNRRQQPLRTTISIDRASDAVPYAYWIEKRPLRLLLPAGMLRMQGGFAYEHDHPFVKALSEGAPVLSRFYASFSPENLAGMYRIPAAGRTGEALPPWELPWVMRRRRTAPGGERGLPPEHGVSFYGPASREKVAMEYRRLCKTTERIRRRGYLPDRYGDIEGHLLTDGKDACFFVRGGKHRAAVLVHLGYERLPVLIRRTWPPVVDSRTANFWPLVEAGEMDIGLARDILDVYLRGNHA